MPDAQANGAKFCAAMLLLALLGACAAPAPKKINLVFSTQEAGAFPGYRELAQGVAFSYVQVIILDNPRDRAGRDESATAAYVNGGSGIIVDARGYVVTAAHIALGTQYAAEVKTTDGRTRKAAIIDVDRARELALLRVEDSAGLQAANFAAPESLKRDDPVLAIGTPDAQPGVVAVGKVLEARVKKPLRYFDYGYDQALKLSIEITPGFSGGPVFNRNGEMIGMIASFVLGDLGKANYVSPGIAYAIPADAIREYLQRAVPH
ncbi:MAG: S1C family serine protease [Burkholderiales bacterium]